MFPPEVFFSCFEYGHPTLFTIKLYHGGEFTKYPDVRYIDGTVNYFDMVDIDEFSVHELDAIMKGFRYGVPPVIYYHFLVPGGDFHFGLRPLGNDQDVANFSQYVSEHKVMKVYTEHAKDFVDTSTDFDIGLYQQILQSNVDGVNGTDMHDVNEPQMDEENQPHMDEENQPQMNDFWDFNYQTDAFVRDGSENQPQSNIDSSGKENESEVESKERSETEHEDDSDDSDYWVDEDNVIEDVEVDMRDFNMSIDTEVEFLDKRARNPRQHESDEEADELDVIDNDAFDSMDEDSDQDRKRRAVLKQLSKEKSCSLGEVHKCHFKIGQKYNSKQELKEKIKMHALETKKNIAFKKNDKSRLRAICNGVMAFTNDGVGGPTQAEKSKGKIKGKSKGKSKEKDKQGGTSQEKADSSCPWMLHASRSTDASSWYIKTYEYKHTCMNTRKVKAATTNFMSKQIMDQVESNPTIPVKALQEQLQKKYGVGFSIHKVFRAKADAKKIVVGDYKKQYEVLRDYILELQSTNPDTTVKLELGDVSESNLMFQKNLCLSRGVKKGFKACLRDFLGLDEAHIKGPYPGQILTAVGLDSNNGIYPLAYAIVEIENCESWKWFLECLGDDLDLHAMSNFTFVSDRQKGLLQVVSQLFPCAGHRFCLRHIHENMKKQWRTKEYKDHLWDCATATTVLEFNHFMHQFSLYDKSAYEWLKSIPPQHLAKSHFTGRATIDMLLNNLCEVFNGKLVDGRGKPIISCLEFIREYMMKRIYNVLKCVGLLTSTTTKIMEKNEAAATQYIAEWCGDEKYQVKGPWNDQHVVDMHERVCSCRKWELTGIPCRHVIYVLYNKADHGECVHELHTYVHKVHWLKTWKTAFEYKVEPIKGLALWPRSECPMQITPPPHRNQPGRPKRNRRQSMEEKSQSKSQIQSQRSDVGPSEIHGHGPHGSRKLTRKFVNVTCSKCGNKGHNSKTCKGRGGT
uniref:SWIM-type domain-containing protein n=1 Tax=Lactuca sativa TaxID=4236 RepID=A0A9R1XRT0_LACSA|nr:hypothetical protein LSAT_V11C100025760 [Lactuca sativa]